jgi:hypothetical protein
MWPTRQSVNQVPAHWSKDFVEHLRTVHLTLIATIAALLVVALTTKFYSTEVAKNELHKIQELRIGWGPKTVFLMNKESVDHRTPKPRPLTCRNCTNTALQESIPVSTVGFDGFYDESEMKTLQEQFKGTDSKQVHRYELRQLKYVKVKFAPDQAVVNDFENQLPLIPDTITGFRHWWDSLDGWHYVVYFPETVAPEGNLMEVRGGSDLPVHGYTDRDAKRIFGDLMPLRMISFSDAKVSWLPKDSFENPRLFYALTFTDPKSGKLKGNWELQLDVDKFAMARLDNPTVASYLDVPTGTFDRIFYDLRMVAGVNGINNFSKLEELLSKSEVSDAPVFEAFGIEFPADIATLGGTVALLSVSSIFLCIFVN